MSIFIKRVNEPTLAQLHRPANERQARVFQVRQPVPKGGFGAGALRPKRKAGVKLT